MDRRVLATTLLALGGGPLGLFLNRFPQARRLRVELVGTEGRNDLELTPRVFSVRQR